MKDYQRITKDKERQYVNIMWKSDGYFLKIYNRLADLESKIESGEIDYVADKDAEIARLTAENQRLKEEAAEQKSIAEHEHATQMEWFRIACDYKAENAELKARLEKAVELPCKVGDKVYGVGFTDCEDSRTTDEKKKRQIFNVCMKMGGNCEKCKYRRPQIEEFVCTHIQLGDCGIEGKSILIVGDRNENYTANNVFTTSEAAEARLNELKGEKK